MAPQSRLIFINLPAVRQGHVGDGWRRPTPARPRTRVG
jgi:hypothetical protein